MKLKEKYRVLLDETFFLLEVRVEIHFLEKFIQRLRGKRLFGRK